MEKPKRLIGREKAAELLDMTPNALSCHVARRNWNEIPKPARVGGRYKWTVEQISKWIDERFDQRCVSSTVAATKRKPGRPRKTRSASC